MQSVAIKIDGNANYGAMFVCERMSQELMKIDTISFDGTLFTCLQQFKQLWTIFVIFQRHIPSYSVT